MKHRTWLSRLGGYLLIPHELLHVAGFWLVGKRCEYRWGNSHVTPPASMTRWQHLIGILFPFLVFAITFIVCTIWAGLAYEQVIQGASMIWFIFGLILMQITALYAGTTLVDLRKAYLLMVNKPWHSRTPLDIFFWPVVDWTDVRRASFSEVNKDDQQT